MQDSKGSAWAQHYSGASRDQEVTADKSEDNPENDGWQQYRRWISKAPAPKGRRTGVDPSLYTWKGYRNWTEQVKRNWRDG